MEKKFIKNIFAKVLLFICVTITLAILYYKILPIFNAYGLQAFYIKNYTDTENFESEYEHIIISLANSVYRGINLDSYDEKEFSYFNGNTNWEYILDIELTNGKKMLLSNISKDEDFIRETMYGFSENSSRFYICSLNSNPETSEDYLEYRGFNADQSKFSKLDVYIRIDNFEKPDSFQTRKINYENFTYNYPKLLILLIVLISISIVLIIYITKNLENKKNFLDKMYFEEIVVLLYLIAIIGEILILGNTSWVIKLDNIYKYIIYFISYLFIFEAYLLLVKRIKFKDIKNNFIIPKIGKNMDKLYKLVGIDILIFIGISFVYNITDNSFEKRDVMNIIIPIIIISLLYIIKIRLELIEISKKTEEISNGDFNIKLRNRNKIYGNLVNSINNIQKGMKEAVNEKVKTERLKTDLITNVSHDLKTPLTSIINYTKLLKKENIQNENVKKYIDILENKSIKLKNLTEDLIDISKLSSGCEKVNLERLNFIEMVLQANGEFAEKFEEKKLCVISNFTSEEIFLNLDSNKMWRVLENIYSNMYKYALENTRIYIDVVEKENGMEFIAKNISKQELNIDSNELMERFVRGDKTRTNEGNGLGLSIAKELIELQGGKFNIHIEGDLFKVIIELLKY